jgi:hypothetical protein
VQLAGDWRRWANVSDAFKTQPAPGKLISRASLVGSFFGAGSVIAVFAFLVQCQNNLARDLCLDGRIHKVDVCGG